MRWWPGVGISARQQQQIFYQPGKPFDVHHEIGRQGAALAEPLGDLQLRLNARQWAAQFMSRVRHKRPLPFLRFTQPVEHLVKGDSQGADFVRSWRHRESLAPSRTANAACSADLLGPRTQLFHRP